MMMAEKFQDVQMASRRPGRSIGVIPIEIQRPENQKSPMV